MLRPKLLLVVPRSAALFVVEISASPVLPAADEALV